ncbi:hypothetical protein A4D02_28745 [Niastella koreensis]|uniref:VWFA domain-containing protein n=2 Tax=Niastella koreensis TaxID=354356 RepID=G8T786_NIAKG|nr:hypothetical protein [Niastella koreensis]AEW00111.1 hypothetical protein Niako_3817 [Niastella koreensis GR20-10]OQP49581.1 hypothetical protein A4D02_28745 [Niastella koreensis]
MGNSSWSNDAYKHLRANYSTKSTAQVFGSRSIDKDMSPRGVAFRESRDSVTHPESLAIGVFLDETGSMGAIPEMLVRHKLGHLMNTLLAHGVPDAHVLFGGIGDQYADHSPLQVGQFEAGTDELNQWLTKIFLEGGGGGQSMESYALAWLFFARHTSIDCFEKRNQKGFLFTIGDEGVHKMLEKDFLSNLLGYQFYEDIPAEQLLAEAQRMYHVFHLHVTETGTGTSGIIHDWRKLLQERLILVEDYNNIAEIIASTVAVVMGADLKKVVAAFDTTTAQQVSNALVQINNGVITGKQSGIVSL